MLYSTLNKLSSFIFCLLFANSVYAGITDLKLSTAQIFDVQWNISGNNLNTSNFNYIYSSVNYATQTTSAARWTAAQTADAGSNGRYIGFIASPTVSNTYGMAVFNSDGSVYKWINYTGSFRALANGAIFYNGNGMWGTLITTQQGYNLGSSATFTVTQSYPTNQQLASYQPPSSTPLAAGETATSSAPPPPPTPVYGNYTITNSQQTRKTANQSQASGHNAQIDILGDDNIVSVQQIGSSGHFVQVDVTGNVNTVNVLQTSNTMSRHYLETTITGSNNTANIAQRDTAKTAFVEINGSANSVITNQKDSGNHYLNLNVSGNNHTASVVQEGSGNHAASVTLNGSQPWNFNLNQSGSTNKAYSLPHSMTDGSTVSGTCSAIGGCNLTVNQ
jgi:hypothetical protein